MSENASTATICRETLSVGAWQTNGELIADVARLGWITDYMTVLDVTYGHGKFWTDYKPPHLLGVDLNPTKSDPDIGPVDFLHPPFPSRSFDAVVFDPPYKLSGTPSLDDFDERYGIEAPTRWQDRMALIAGGAARCADLARLHLLVKVQDQVCSGAMRWQTREVADAVEPLGFRQADRFDFGALRLDEDNELDVRRGRPQPPGREQKHARHQASQLLIFTRRGAGNGSKDER